MRWRSRQRSQPVRGGPGCTLGCRRASCSPTADESHLAAEQKAIAKRDRDLAVNPLPQPNLDLSAPRPTASTPPSRSAASAGGAPGPMARGSRLCSLDRAGRSGAGGRQGGEEDSPKGSTARPTSRSPPRRRTASCSDASSSPLPRATGCLSARRHWPACSRPWSMVDLGRLENEPTVSATSAPASMERASDCRRGCRRHSWYRSSSGTTLVKRGSMQPPGRRSRRRRPS